MLAPEDIVVSSHSLLLRFAALLVPALALACGGGSEGSAPVGMLVDAEQGGVVTSEDGRLTLEIPPGALAEDTTITIARLSERQWSDEVAALEPVSDVYALGPNGLRFAVPARLTQQLDHDDIAAFPLLAGVTRSADGELSMLDAPSVTYEIAASSATFTANVEHFSDVFVTTQLRPIPKRDDPPGELASELAKLELGLERPHDSEAETREQLMPIASTWRTDVRLSNTGEMGLELVDVTGSGQGLFSVGLVHDRTLPKKESWRIVAGEVKQLGFVRWQCNQLGAGGAAVHLVVRIAGDVGSYRDFDAKIVDDYRCVPQDAMPEGTESDGGDEPGGDTTTGTEGSESDTEGTTSDDSSSTGDTGDTGGESTTGDGSGSSGTTGGEDTGSEPWQACIGLPAGECEACCERMAQSAEQFEACVMQC